MTTTVQAYEPLGHGEAMVLAAAEYSRLITLLESLTEDEWQRPTECTPWTVRDMATHLLGYMRFSCSVREQARQLRAAKRRGGSIADSVAALQVEELRDLSPAQILTEIRERAEPAVRGRRRVPAVVRRGVRVAAELPVSGRQERWPMGYLVDIIGTRDGWMHRLDLCRALGREPVLTPEHDGRLVADVAGEWARRHGQPVDLHLTGPAGGHFGTGSGKTALSYDAITFCRLPPDATASPSWTQKCPSSGCRNADARSAEDKLSDHLAPADQAMTRISLTPLRKRQSGQAEEAAENGSAQSRPRLICGQLPRSCLLTISALLAAGRSLGERRVDIERPQAQNLTTLPQNDRVTETSPTVKS